MEIEEDREGRVTPSRVTPNHSMGKTTGHGPLGPVLWPPNSCSARAQHLAPACSSLWTQSNVPTPRVAIYFARNHNHSVLASHTTIHPIHPDGEVQEAHAEMFAGAEMAELSIDTTFSRR